MRRESLTVMGRRAFGLFLAVAVVASVSAIASATSSHGQSACTTSTFCAGAASADITPPVTTPMWGYTARQGVMYSGTNVADDALSAAMKLGSADVAGFVAGLTSIKDEQFVHDKTDLDTDLYDKTFVSNHGIDLRLFANAFVLVGTNGVKEAVVQTDLGGLPGEAHQAVADRLVADGIGIDRAHLLIAATHTHQGPGAFFQYQGYALLGGDEYDPRVFDAIVSGITRAIETANGRVKPAKMAWGQISLTDASHNRRLFPQFCEDPENACDASLKPTAASPPSNDPLLTVIRLDRTDGVPIGVITNFAAHGTVGGDHNLLFSGDNQGWATRLVEQGIAGAYGRPLPPGWEVVDALLNGAQGDQAPSADSGPLAYPGVNSQYAAMEDGGRRQMAPALAEWRALGSRMRTDVSVDSRFEFLCFCGQKPDHPYDGPKIDKSDPLWDHVSPYASLGDGGITLDDGTSSPVALPAQGHKMPAVDAVGLNPSIVRMEVLRIGDLLVAGFPGEPTVTVGRRAKAALRALDPLHHVYSDVIVAGLTDDYDSYFASPEEYTAYQYEGSFTLFGPQESVLLIDELAGLTQRMLDGQAVPDCTVPTPSTAQFCVLHPVHPDTSALSFPPTPITIDPAAKIVTQPAGAANWFTAVSFVWDGGAPSAEWIPEQDHVEIQRKVGQHWVTVFGDRNDGATLLRYDKVNAINVWTADWDIARDVAAGTYRFHVLGAVGGAGGARVPYRLDSSSINVSTPAVPLKVVPALTSSTSADVRAFYPADPNGGFRDRAVCDGVATLIVMRNGSRVTLSEPVDTTGITTFALQAGDSIVSASVTDALGNTGSSS